MDSCSIGTLLESECHKTTYVNNSYVESIPDDQKYILATRTSLAETTLHTICAHHNAQYITYFSSSKVKCCDINKRHSKPVKTKLCTISLELHHEFPELTPGDKICYKCINHMRREKESTTHVDSDYEDSDTSIPLDEINRSLTYHDLSPIDKAKKSKAQLKKEILTKTAKISDAQPSSSRSEENIDEMRRNSESMIYLIEKLKEKYSSTTSYEERLKILTLAPKHFTLADIQENFGATKYMARQARKILSREGVLGCRTTRKGAGYTLSQDMKTKIASFFEEDDNSRILPGKKDVVSIRTDDGKQLKQKRLVLCKPQGAA